MKTALGPPAAALLWAALSCACAGVGTQAPAPTRDPFPPEGFLRGWKREGPPRIFEGAGLYGHIDGGAEVFLEMGFDRVKVQRYRRGDAELLVEVYRMIDPTAALGVYLLKCGRETPLQGLHARNTANRWQALLCRGTAFVILSNCSGDESASRALPAFAHYVTEGIPEAKGPDPFDVLPKEHRVPGSERVIRGPFTLTRTYTLGEGDLLLLRKYGVTAVAAEYAAEREATFTRIVAPYPDENAAAAAFENARVNLDPHLEVTGAKDSLTAFTDYEGKGGRIRLEGKYIEILVNLPRSP